MSSIRALDVVDIARSLGDEPMRATPEGVAEWLLADYSKGGGGGFNYDPAILALYDAFRGWHTLKSAVLSCLTSGNPKGRRQNAEAIRAVMPYALENLSTCHRIGLTAVAIGRFDKRTVYAKIKAPLLRVGVDRSYIVMPGFRMNHRPSEVAIDVACSIAMAVFSQSNMAGTEFEYLYAGPGIGGGRQFRAIHGTGRRRFGESDIDTMLNVFVHGVAIAAGAGVSIREPKLDGYRIIDPDQPTMF
jgi:hypothetical protein